MASTLSQHLTERSSSERSLCFPCLQKLDGAPGRVKPPRGRAAPAAAAPALPAAGAAAPRPRPAGCRPCPPVSTAEIQSSLRACGRTKILGGSDTLPLSWEGGRQRVHARGCFFPPPLPLLLYSVLQGGTRGWCSCPLKQGFVVPFNLQELTSTHLYAPLSMSTTAPHPSPQDSPPHVPQGLPSASMGTRPWREALLWWASPHGQNLLPWSGCFQSQHRARRPFRLFSL